MSKPIVAVIIPTTGAPELLKAVMSVLNQSYEGKVKTYVIVDGPEFKSRVEKTLKPLKVLARGRHIFSLQNLCVLPHNVGANGFYGHKVYAAFAHLVDADYIVYLDQDVWLEPDHIENCIRTITENHLDWCYSLRNIVAADGTFICQDNCESLGKWKAWGEDRNHIDTNCYCVKREIAISLSPAWQGGWGQDRVFYSTLNAHYPNYKCSGKYTVNYRLGGNEGSVKSEYFLTGNVTMHERWKGEYPWQKI